jgi:hypothetical protein
MASVNGLDRCVIHSQYMMTLTAVMMYCEWMKQKSQPLTDTMKGLYQVGLLTGALALPPLHSQWQLCNDPTHQ